MNDPRMGDTRFCLQFDQYQRYAAAAGAVERLRTAPIMSVLEVGANVHSNLRRFLPADHLVFVEPGITTAPQDAESYVSADGTRLPFAEGAFDVALALDVIEHVPAAQRGPLVRELARVSRTGFIVAAPFDSAAAHEVEGTAHQFWRDLVGTPHPWLDEHAEFGLPPLGEIEACIRDQGFYVIAEPNGNAELWLQLMRLHLMDAAGQDPHGLARRMDAAYAREVFEHDRLEPTYRHVLIAARVPQQLVPSAPADGALVRVFTRAAGLLCEALEAGRREKAQLRDVLGAHVHDVENDRDRVLKHVSQVEARLQDEQRTRQAIEAELAQLRVRLAEVEAQYAQLRQQLEVAQQAFGEASEALSALTIQLQAWRRHGLRDDARSAGWHRLMAEPARGLRPVRDCEQWEAVDIDPQFALHGFDAIAPGWVELRMILRSDVLMQVPPSLYLDFGRGFSETNAQSLSFADRDGVISVVLNLAERVRAARLDPMAQPCIFQLESIQWRRLSRVGAALRMIRRLGLRPALQIVSHALLSRQRLANALVDGYRRVLVVRGHDYSDWIAAFEPPLSAYQRLAEIRSGWTVQPLISVLMPAYNTPERYLREAVESVRGQHYGHWELCIANDASSRGHVKTLLDEFARMDPRIRVVHREANGHISEASNSALELARGEFVALLDHDDLLHPLALHYVAEAINDHPDVELVYTDEDKIDAAGRRHDPYFKCELNYELLLAQNMICHLAAYRTELVRRLGGFRRGFEGAQDYDLTLRVVESASAERVVHVPRVLYHWRSIPGSTASSVEEKPYAVLAGRRAVSEHLVRRGVEAEVSAAPSAAAFNRVRYRLPRPAPRVSIVIPTRDRADLLSLCVDSIAAKTSYPDYEVLIVDNGSGEESTFALFRRLDPRHFRVLRDESEFNFSALNNRAVAASTGQYICLMNNDIEVITPDWIEEMLSFAAQPDVGCVGARLWYPNYHLQHGGVVLGVGGVAGHSHKFLPRGQSGYFGRAVLHQAFSAVTAACLMIRRSTYEQVAGLDETLRIAFNDIDFCLRVRRAGYRNVWTPYAEFAHHESATRGHETTPEKRLRFAGEVECMKKRWGRLLEQDPAYSPNLTLMSEDFALGWPSRVSLLT